MKIRRLNIQVTGDTATGRSFAWNFSATLVRNLPAGWAGGRIDHLSVPAVQARPGESPRRLAGRTAATVAEALRAANKGVRS